MITANKAKRSARKAENSDPVEHLARFGLVCRGIIWLVVGMLAVDATIGGGTHGGRPGGHADRQGALAVIKDQPFGEVLLLVLAAGFAGYAAWRLLEGAVGHRDAEEGRKRWFKRIASLGRGLIYASLCVTTVHFLLGSGSKDNTKPAAARVMSHSGGTFLVGAVGLAVVIGGLVMAVRGVRQKFDDKLKPVPKAWCKPVQVVATVGLVGRGLVIALIGGFLVQAAVTFDPGKAKGLDAALKAFAGHAYGRGILGLAALGLLCFGLWSFAEARWRKI